jgi:two-component system, NtrC family, response regulator HydG
MLAHDTPLVSIPEHSRPPMRPRLSLREVPRLVPRPGPYLAAPPVFEGLVGSTPAMRELFDFIARLAPYPTTALITGESGTGKELVAQAIHRLSPRSQRPLVVCNCTTLAPTLIDTELFGHVRGAFTGADRDRKGLFEAAHGGTIFLDEIGDLPPSVQAKLLRVLEEREIRRVGSTEPTPVDVRVVAATNRDLSALVAAAGFRDDLYYRLNVGTVLLPPLRERLADLEPLVRHFIIKCNHRLGRCVTGVSPDAVTVLGGHTWPGNVRELGNVIERAMVAATGNVILPEHLPPQLRYARTASSTAPAPLTLEAAERDQIIKALAAAGGRRVDAAKLLGLSRRTLYRKLERHGID